MANPHWLKRLQQELRRQRLPSDYISRLVEELSDHAADLMTEKTSMDAAHGVEARLGSPEQLASLAGHEFRRRTFAGRHPVLTFMVGPVAAIVATLVSICLVGFVLSLAIDALLGVFVSSTEVADFPSSALEMGIVRVYNALVRFLPFAISAWLFVRLGERAGLRVWSISAACVVALMAACFSSVVTPASLNEPPKWIIGVGLNLGLDQFVQAAVPLLLAGWLIRRQIPARGPQIAA